MFLLRYVCACIMFYYLFIYIIANLIHRCYFSAAPSVVYTAHRTRTFINLGYYLYISFTSRTKDVWWLTIYIYMYVSVYTYYMELYSPLKYAHLQYARIVRGKGSVLYSSTQGPPISLARYSRSI